MKGVMHIPMKHTLRLAARHPVGSLIMSYLRAHQGLLGEIGVAGLKGGCGIPKKATKFCVVFDASWNGPTPLSTHFCCHYHLLHTGQTQSSRCPRHPSLTSSCLLHGFFLERIARCYKQGTLVQFSDHEIQRSIFKNSTVTYKTNILSFNSEDRVSS